jgi:hypothetical protein
MAGRHWASALPWPTSKYYSVAEIAKLWGLSTGEVFDSQSKSAGFIVDAALPRKSPPTVAAEIICQSHFDKIFLETSKLDACAAVCAELEESNLDWNGFQLRADSEKLRQA